MEADLAVMAGLSLTEPERSDLKLGEEKKLTGLYCSQCRKCLDQCPAGVEVPALMRAYMYTYGYRNLAWAKDALAGVGTAGLPCTDCGSCQVRCTMGFDVRRKARDVARLRDVPDEFVI